MNTTCLLTSRITTNPDLSGWNFFVQYGGDFDSFTYADAFFLNHDDIDSRSIRGISDAASRLKEGQWLEVMHDEI